MAIKVTDLKEHIGSEVHADAATLLQPEVGRQLRDLLVQRGVLVFRQLGLSDEQQVQLAGMIGTVRNEGEKGIYKIALDKATNPHGDYLKGSFLWHMDGTHDQVPVFGCLLTAKTLSNIGGQTEFANSYAAYSALPEETRHRIANLRVVHSFETSMTAAGVERTPQNSAHWDSIPVRTHNLVWTHESGRKSLVIGCHASHIEGMDLEEGRALLRELLEWTTQPQFVYRHEWSVGDMLMWDNTGVLHRVEPYPVDCGREMHRTSLVGEEAFS